MPGPEPGFFVPDTQRYERACLCRMKTHESQAPSNGISAQQRRGIGPIMQVHENHSIKRAGVAGVRVRATYI